VIQIINCKKTYDHIVLFENLNFTAKKGDCILIIGANGSGKTTILKAILGIISVDEGRIMIDENSSIGFLLDDGLLYDEFSIENNMKLYCALSGIKRLERRGVINHWLNYFGLYELRKKKVKKISSGMKKRLSLAIANLKNPGIILLDEPLNGLDPEYQEKFVNLIQSKICAGSIVIIASHIVDLLKPVVNRRLILENGELRVQSND
jgi:ABC-2 type transport system ATP-binding protein